jgi:xanthine dehydrogenase YagS FAD-binding subunit
MSIKPPESTVSPPEGSPEGTVSAPSRRTFIATTAVGGAVVAGGLGPDGERTVPFAAFLLKPGSTPNREQALRTGELITAVEIPALPRPLKSGYLKVRDRQSYEFALTSAAVALHIGGGVIRQAKVAAGGVGTVPWKLPASGSSSAGGRPTTCGPRPPSGRRTGPGPYSTTVSRSSC